MIMNASFSTQGSSPHLLLPPLPSAVSNAGMLSRVGYVVFGFPSPGLPSEMNQVTRYATDFLTRLGRPSTEHRTCVRTRTHLHFCFVGEPVITERVPGPWPRRNPSHMAAKPESLPARQEAATLGPLERRRSQPRNGVLCDS